MENMENMENEVETSSFADEKEEKIIVKHHADGRISFPGSSLINAIREKQEINNLTLSELAEVLKMSKPYLIALLNGKRSIAGIRKKYEESIAQFLQIPCIQVAVLSERYRPNDFTYHPTLSQELDRMIKHMRNDPLWLKLAPSEEDWKKTPLRSRTVMAMLYEQISHLRFIEGVTSFQFEEAVEPETK
jgi:transcriptional regulator with XRE-family HTH domain